jgi:hypothetical protein
MKKERTTDMRNLFLVLLCVGCGGDHFASFGATHEVDSGSEAGGGVATSDEGDGAPGGSAGTSGASGSGGEHDAGSGGTVSSGGSGGHDAGQDAGGAVNTGGVPGSTGGSPAGGTSGSGGSSSGGTGGSPGECSTGAVQCVDAQRQTCIGGIWLDNGAPCPGWCIDGACTECRSGDRSCASATQPRTCGASGSWAFDAGCAGDKPWCSEGSCIGYCCLGGAFHVACDASNPWMCSESGTDPTPSACSNPTQCPVGDLCVVQGGFTGTVEICP